MSYIGRGVDAISNVEKLDNITFNGGTTYALTKSSAAFTPSSSNAILISIDGVVQQGNFSVSTTNIVFDWSPTSSNTCPRGTVIFLSFTDAFICILFADIDKFWYYIYATRAIGV